MPRPPFQMKPSRPATLTCDGKFVVGGRASFVWETYLQRRAAGVPGDYQIRRSEPDAPWHQLDWTIGEAEEELAASAPRWRTGAYIARLRGTRARRAARGLPVA